MKTERQGGRKMMEGKGVRESGAKEASLCSYNCTSYIQYVKN